MTKIHWLANDVGVIDDFMTSDECASYINMSESMGYDDAPVSTGSGMVMMKDVRNNDRVMIDDEARAGELFARLEPHVPATFKGIWHPVGVNERLRFYRYDRAQQFDWHLDGYFERDNGERSFFTFMVYLNDDFEGGETDFRDHAHKASGYDGLSITPRQGMALLFHHPIPHRGAPVTSGRKYVLRSDVMYAQ